MPKYFLRLLLAGVIACGLPQAQAVAAPAPAAAAASKPGASPAASTPSPAAGSSPSVSTPAPAPAPAPASTPAPAKPTEPASSIETTALEENGLVAQMLAQLDRWNESFESQLRQMSRVIVGLPAMLQGFGESFSSEYGRALLVRAAVLLLAVFAISLVLEWALRHALAGLRRSLIEHGEHLHPPEPAAPLAGLSPASTTQAQKKGEMKSEMRPPAEGVALVRSQRDGVEQVEMVQVEPPRLAIPPGQPSPAAAQAMLAEQASDAALWKASFRHWGKLRQLPLALGVLLLDLLPLALFFFATSLVLHWMGGSDLSLRHMVRSLVGAYVSTRAAAAVLRFLVAPAGYGIPMLRVRAEIAQILYLWLRRIIVTAAFGIGIASAAEGLGAGPDERLAFMKIVSLLVHVFAVILIFRIRRPVSALIAANSHARGPLASARNRLAEGWSWFAAIVVMGIWVVWALGVQDGFPRLVHFIAVTAGIIIVARVVAILVLGALGRMFHKQPNDEAEAAAESAAEPASEAKAAAASTVTADTVNARLRADRYYLLTQRLVSALISVATVIALLQVWGFDVLAWLTERPIGRSLLSAVLTIAISVIVGVVVWEVANAAVERRLGIWNALGDTLRAARLRTLLPILRTCLLIVIVLVVGLTALNEIGINTAPLLAGASIIGVALGFGSQKLVQDFITGIFLLMENAMQVGDWVTVAGVSGTVENLSIRTVRLRAGDGSLHIVPFSSVSTVNNSNRGLGNAVMRVSVVFGTDIDLVLQELKQIGADLRADPAFRDKILGDLEIWGVDAVDGATVTIAGQIRCTDKGRWGVQRDMNRRILERFSALGIRIADPRASVLLTPASARPGKVDNPAESKS